MSNIQQIEIVYGGCKNVANYSKQAVTFSQNSRLMPIFFLRIHG